MTCANCGKTLNGIYRIVAFDRPVRRDVPTCGGRCRATVAAWDLSQFESHLARQSAQRREQVRARAR